jgi:hypothetical protein
MIKFNIDTSQLTSFTKIVASLEQELNLRGAEDEIVTIVQRSVAAQLDSEGARAGAKYKPLDPRYSRYKVKKFGQKKILERTGRMRAGLLSSGGVAVQLSGDGRRMDISFTGEAGRVAAYQQEERPVVALNDADRDAIQVVAFRRIVDGFGKRLKGG